LENSTYELELVPIKLNETSIELWAVKRWKDVVETENENEQEYISHFPLWIKIWEASIVLCEHLSQRITDMNANILELGAGTGLTGMMLGAKGHHVTLTDYNDDALKLLRKNIEHNKLKNTHVEKLDWVKPDVDRMYDIIYGSELIYKEALIEPLLDLLQKCIQPDGTIYIAHDVNRQVMSKFLKRAESIFQIQSRAKTLKSNGDKHRIAIHTLQNK
jgi:16S rRNA G1207 methylase RsmC